MLCAGELPPVSAVELGLQSTYISSPVPTMGDFHEKDGKREHRAATPPDISPLGATADFLRLVLDTDPNLIFVKDYQGRFLLVNKATAEIYGSSATNLIGKTDADFNANSEEVRHFRQADQEVIATNRPKFIPEERVTDARTGQVRWFQTYKVPLQTATTEVTHLLGVSTDITERKSAEKSLADALDQLLQAQKMESIGRFAGGIAHDFNNLLTVIIGSCEQLLHSLPADDPNVRTVGRIGECADRAASLVQHLLAFGRKQVLQPRVIDLNAIIIESKPILERLMDEGVEIVTGLNSAPALVRADPVQIQQVLMNLAVNAKDAMPNGGLLRMEVRNDDHTSQGNRSGGSVRLTVSDNGCGIEAHARSKIFDPFFTTKPAGKGTGLDLSTVYGIVTQSGGTIVVDSEPGHGTVFTITLPRNAEGVEAPEENQRTDILPRGDEIILLVEDQGSVREVVHLTLSSLGYTVLAASSAADATGIWNKARDKIQLIITDMVMPGENGRVLVERLRLESQEAKVLYMSGYAEDAIFQNGILNDKVHFIQKPFTASQLARKVRSVLNL